MINFSLTLLFAVLLADGILGLAVWLRASRKKVNIIFALLTFSFMLWSGTGYYDQTADINNPFFSFMAGVPFIGGIFIAFFITLFSLYFPETRINPSKTRHKVWWLLVLTTIPVTGIFLFASKLTIANVTTSASAGNNIVPGPLYITFPIFFLTWVIFALTNLIRKFRRSEDALERTHLTYIFMGLLTFTGVAFLTNVIIPVLAHTSQLARYGFLSTLFIVGFFGYTIVAHRLFNIRLLVARSIAYTLLLLTISGLYALGIFGAGSLLFSGQAFSTGESVTLTVLAVTLSFTLQPLRRFFEKITNGIFFRDRYDSQVVLNNVSSILASEILLDALLNKCLREICKSLNISTGRFVILNEGDIYKRVVYGRALQRGIPFKAIQKLRPGTLVADELEPGERKGILEMHEVRVSLELKTSEETIGFLLLGDKLSGDIYSNQDIAILEILRKQLAVAIVNARAYERISLFNDTLQDQVYKATRHLSLANKKLKVLDKTKDDFISMASHQLGTPLTAVTGYLSMTLDEDRGNMTVAQREYVAVALESSERLVNMAGDLLNVSRLNAGRFNIMAQPIDLVPLIEQELLQLRPSAERKNLELSFTPPQGAIPPVSIDESKTRQVIMNFIDNAIYYTQKGSIKVTLEKAGDEAVFKVVDTGMGVPPAEQAKLFAKFYRADNAKAARPDGTGLGLYLAKRVIEDQGGEIIFESQFGAGSTFGFKLPFAKSAAKPAEQPAYR